MPALEGVEYGTKNIEVDKEIIRANIWDTSGQEKYRSLTLNYYKNAQGAILVFDMTNILTFQLIPEWAERVNDHCAQGVVKILVGNKLDDTKNIEFEKSKAKLDELMKKYGIFAFFEMSAKENLNVDEGFQKLIEKVKRDVLDVQKKESLIQKQKNPFSTENRPSQTLQQRTQSTETKKLQNKSSKCC